MKETTRSDIIDSDTGVGPTLGSLLIIELEGHCHKKEKEKKKKKTVARFNLQQTGDYQQIFTESLLWAYGLRKKKKKSFIEQPH